MDVDAVPADPNSPNGIPLPKEETEAEVDRTPAPVATPTPRLPSPSPMQDEDVPLHQTDASPHPVTPPRFAAEPEVMESGLEGGDEGEVPMAEGGELRRRSAERRKLSEERQRQEQEATRFFKM